MAGMDYCSCKVCGERLFYDGERRVRDNLNTEYLVCAKCYKKAEKKINKLGADKKRGR